MHCITTSYTIHNYMLERINN